MVVSGGCSGGGGGEPALPDCLRAVTTILCRCVQTGKSVSVRPCAAALFPTRRSGHACHRPVQLALLLQTVGAGPELLSRAPEANLHRVYLLPQDGGAGGPHHPRPPQHAAGRAPPRRRHLPLLPQSAVEPYLLLRGPTDRAGEAQYVTRRALRQPPEPGDHLQEG
ncbi:hypothetical protein AGDE_02020 [Angomonas deanei]|nr:hypothetical protein AGDE_02020 [Angomonas deanei]|eukprot:EPY41903.1 hypothetical protein AGDE_02020 [Angomonas deanei]